MANVNAAGLYAKSATLTGTTADEVQDLAVGKPMGAYLLCVVNHDTTNTVWFTYAYVGEEGTCPSPAAPTAKGDDCLPVLKGGSSSVLLPRSAGKVRVGVLGNGGDYTVCVIAAPGFRG